MANLMTDRRDPHYWKSILLQMTAAALNTLVPPVCLACDCAVGSNGKLCGDCWSRLLLIEKPYCPVLGTPFAYDHSGEFGELSQMTSLAALAAPPAFDRARSVTVYEEISKRLVHGLKFGDRPDLAPWMARWMVRAGQDLLTPKSIIIPVPLHRWRMVKRRYNQSAELARHVARLSHCEYQPGILQRIRPTRQQVGLGARERQRNVMGAFRVASEMEIRLRSRHIVLIDDVFTTGATLQACARALYRKGADSVDCLTFARVVDGVAKADL